MLKELLEFRESSFHKDLYKRERWINEREAYAIYFLLQEHKITRYIEAGTANGFSASIAAMAMKDLNITPDIHTWDIIERPKIWQEPNFQLIKDYVTLYVAPFAEDVNKIRTLPFALKRAFFIDGSHNTGEVRKDWRAVREFLTTHDIVIFHDTQGYQGIRDMMNSLAQYQEYIVSDLTTERGMTLVRKYE